jgi:hypothetical protein
MTYTSFQQHARLAFVIPLLLSVPLWIITAGAHVAYASEPMTLTEGHYINPNPGQLDLGDQLFEALFENTDLHIDKNGTVKGSGIASISAFKQKYEGRQGRGDAQLIMNGTFDDKNQSISGTYSITTDTSGSSYVREKKLEHAWSSEYSGTFSGVPNSDGKLKIVFIGTVAGSGWYSDARGDITEDSYNNPRNIEVIFHDFVGCKDSGARFSDLGGHVEIAPPENLNDWETAELEMVLCEGAVIKTGIESVAIISFADLTSFTMKPETRIIISTAVEKQSKISMVAGHIWVNVKKMIKDGSMEVKMSQAVAGIKGTTFEAIEDGSTSVLKVIEGDVQFTSNTTNETVTIRGGEMVSATQSGLSPVETFEVTSALEEMEELGPEGTSSMQTSETSSLSKVVLVVLLLVITAVLFMFFRKRKS